MSEELIFPDNVPLEELPQVTIVICNYNNEEFLYDAITSALNQTYPKVGIVFIDDCSTDNSWKSVYETYFKKEPHENGNEALFNFKVRRIENKTFLAIKLKKNVGPSEARNVGIRQTIEATDIYCILDADDEMYSHKATRLTAALMQCSNIGVAFGDYDILNTSSNNIIREYKEPYDYNRLKEECIVHSGSAIKKEALQFAKDENGYYDKQMRTCEDYDLWMRIAEKFMILHVAEALTLVKIQPKNSSDTVSKDIWVKNWQRVMQKAQLRDDSTVQ